MTDREQCKRQGAIRSLLIIALLVLVFLVFMPALRYGYSIFDDHMYVSENPVVQAGLTLNGVIWAFTSATANLWHPLTLISHMVVVQLFGMQPGMHHLINLLLHMSNALLLCLVLSRMTNAFWPSFFTAALFALHPLHVESVVWLSARKDLLSTLFWLLAMGSYHAYATANTRSHTLYLVTLVLFMAGLMAKPMVVTLPFVFLLLDFWPLGRLKLPDGSNPVSIAATCEIGSPALWTHSKTSACCSSGRCIHLRADTRPALSAGCQPLQLSCSYFAQISFCSLCFPINLSIRCSSCWVSGCGSGLAMPSFLRLLCR